MTRIYLLAMILASCASRGPLSPEDLAGLPKFVRAAFASETDADGAKRLSFSDGEGRKAGPILDIDWRINSALVSIDFIEPLGSSVGSINFAEDSNTVAIDPNSRLALVQRFGMDEQNYLTIDQHSLALKPSEIAAMFAGKLPSDWRNYIASVKHDKNPNQSFYRLIIAGDDRSHEVNMVFDRKMRAEEICSKTQWSRFFGLGPRSVVVCINGNELKNGTLDIPKVVRLQWTDVSE